MDNNIKLTLNNGLGDKLLDLIGFSVICKYLNYTPYVNFYKNNNFIWGNTIYDIRLFNFNEIIISNNDDQKKKFIEKYELVTTNKKHPLIEYFKSNITVKELLIIHLNNQIRAIPSKI
jgi:hypothetical protein